MIIFHTILFLPSDIEMWGKQVNLYITWIIWSRVVACYEDDVCVLFQCYQQNNKITLIAALIEILQGLGCIFYFLTFSVFPLIKRTNFSQMIQLASHLLNPNLLNMQTLWEFFVLIFQFKERCRICYDLMLSLHFTFIHSHCNALAQPIYLPPAINWHRLWLHTSSVRQNIQISIWSCGTYMMTSGSSIWLTLNTDCCWCCCTRCCCWS